MKGYGRVVERSNGGSTRMIGVMYDITSYKLLEKQKDEFLGIASHELKTPITGIKAYAELLLSMFEEAGNQEYVSLMQKLDNQVDRLTDLIRTLLDATQVAEGLLPLHMETFDLNALITDHLEYLRGLSKKHPLIFKAGTLRPIMADKERIAQVLTNLISNAIKYSPDGGEIIIRSEVVKEGIMVSVQDSGIGIPEDMQAKVFDRFFRVGYAQADTFPGMGLGLYISAGIVQRHGGTIAVESKPGKGSRFYFILPYNAIT